MTVAEARPFGIPHPDGCLGLRPRTLHEQHRAPIAQARGQARDVAVGCPAARAHGHHREHLGDRRGHREPARTGLGNQHEPGQIDPQPLRRLGAELRARPPPRTTIPPARRRPAARTGATADGGDRVRGARAQPAARQERSEGGEHGQHGGIEPAPLHPLDLGAQAVHIPDTGDVSGCTSLCTAALTPTG